MEREQSSRKNRLPGGSSQQPTSLTPSRGGAPDSRDNQGGPSGRSLIPSTEAQQVAPPHESPRLPSLESLLPNHVFQRLLQSRETISPSAGSDPLLYQTSTSPGSSSQATRSSWHQAVHRNDQPEEDFSTPANPGMGHRRRSLSESFNYRGAQRPEDDPMAGEHYGDMGGPSQSSGPPGYERPVRWRLGRPRSSSPIHQLEESQNTDAASSSRRPKTRKAWTDFERDVIREYCLWLLSTPEYQGETVLPPDPETWEEIKDALWEMYPGRFQRSRQGIMELARKMNLRRGTREELQKRQARPSLKDEKSPPADP